MTTKEKQNIKILLENIQWIKEELSKLKQDQNRKLISLCANEKQVETTLARANEKSQFIIYLQNILNIFPKNIDTCNNQFLGTQSAKE